MPHSIVKFSQIEDRLDAEYYKPEFLSLYKKFWQKKFIPIDKFIACNKRGVQPIYVDNSDYRALTSQYIQPEGIKYEQLPFVSENFFHKAGEALIKLEDIVIYTTGAYVGNAQIWLDENTNAIASNHVNILRVKNINPYFLTAVLISEIGSKQIKRIISGATQAELYSSDIAKILVPQMSKEDQNKIGSLIVNAHKKRQIARQKYQEAQNLLEKFLKIDEQKLNFEKCFSLPFSKIEDRIDGEYYKPKYFKADEILKKSGYKIIKLGDIAGKVYYGTSQKVIYQKQGVPFLRVTDVDNFYNIEPENGKFISKIEADGLQSYAVRKDDLLVSRTGTLGSMVYIDEKLNGSIFGSYFIKVVLKKDAPVLPLFVSIFLNSKIGKLQSERFASGGIQTNLTIEMIKNLTLPILRKAKQEKLCNLYQNAILERRESKNLLNQAKNKVENLIGK